MGGYDKIIKENIEHIFLPLLENLLGISISKSIELKDKVQTTIEREPDFLKKIIDKDNNVFLLQLEFQTNDDKEMVYRMAEYKAILQRKFKCPVKQFVIYLGNKPPKMKTELPEQEKITGFVLKNISELNIQQTINSEVPEEIILSILSDYPKSNASEIIKSIILKLKNAVNNPSELNRYIQQLLILSRLRNLEVETKKQVDDMPITYDITKDGLYNEGIEKGIEKGREENREKLEIVILKALKSKVLNITQIADLFDVEIDYVLKIQAKKSRT